MRPWQALQGSPVGRWLGSLLPFPIMALWLVGPPSIVQPAMAAPVPAPSPTGLQSIEVSAPACKAGAFEMIPFLDALRVELAGTGVRCCTLAESDGGPTATVSLRVKVETAPCLRDGDTVQLWVQDVSEARVVHRELSLADVMPAARPRTLALAVAELIRSRGQPFAGEAPPSIAFSAEAPLPAPSSSPGSRVAVRVEGEARILPTRDTLMWGARMRVAAPWRSLHIDLDLGVDRASRQDDLGSVQLRSASVGLGAGPRLVAGMGILDLGLRAELGWAWVRGDTGSANVQSGAGSDLVASLGLRAALELFARSRFRPSIALEGGGVLHGTKGEADGRSVVGMTGYYGLASIGVAVSP